MKGLKIFQYGCGNMIDYTIRYVIENCAEMVGAVYIIPSLIGKDF